MPLLLQTEDEHGEDDASLLNGLRTVEGKSKVFFKEVKNQSASLDNNTRCKLKLKFVSYLVFHNIYYHLIS